jgi:hypothetical protein
MGAKGQIRVLAIQGGEGPPYLNNASEVREVDR